MKKIKGWWCQHKPTTPSSRLWVVGYLDHQSQFAEHAQDACCQSCYRPNSGAFKAQIGDGLNVTQAVNIGLISNKDTAQVIHQVNTG